MSVPEIPTGYTFTLKGIPTTYTVDADAGLDNIRIKEIPKIDLKIERLSVETENNIRIKEIPDIRAHVPSYYNFGVKFLGIEILTFSLCGESQVITEKYVPNKMEICKP